jgi:hypothetical protein
MLSLTWPPNLDRQLGGAEAAGFGPTNPPCRTGPPGLDGTFKEPKGDEMADKKVERSLRGRPATPVQKMQAALSDQGTLDMSDTRHDKGKSALADKFREREDRWRRDQAFHDRETAHETEANRQTPPEANAEDRGEGGGEGGAR